MQDSKIHYANSQYPAWLREADKIGPPTELYVRGRLSEQPLVAVVGTRRPTEYGQMMAFSLARDLAAAGVGVVSGLAFGIDAAAHRGALDAGGYTLAVLGSGLGPEFPDTNRALGQAIVASGGALLTEYPPGMPAQRHHFPARNRIIAGLSLGVVVVEAAAKSGVFHTTKFALEAGRQVMAVPGNVTSTYSAGTNQLLREGAALVRRAADVFEELRLEPGALARPEPTPANATEARILELIAAGSSSSRELIEATGLSAASFAETMTLMEIHGRVRNLGAGLWVKR